LNWIFFCPTQAYRFKSLDLTELAGKNSMENRLIAQREIPKGEPECFTGNTIWLFVLKLPKTLVNSASERKLRNAGKLIYLV